MSALRKEIRPEASEPRTKMEDGGAPATPAAVEVRDLVREENRHREVTKESLEARIKRTEDRIATRRLLLDARTKIVTSKVSGKIASPLLIIAAAGAGFVFAQFRRKRNRGERDSERGDRSEVSMKPSIFSTLTDALTLATTLLAMMPLIRSKAKEGVQEATGEVPPS